VMHSDVIRVQTYVPQDQVSGLQKGVGAIVRVPEMPGVEFRGTVARVASALQPGTRTLLTEIDVPNHEGRARRERPRYRGGRPTRRFDCAGW
jgi:multidrug efflux pump subunit AcrA (membrane-fusion protein)